MGSPHVLEFKSSGGEEAVISSDWSWGVVAWSSLNHGSIIGIVREESLLEFVEGKSSVTVAIVSLDEKINFFLSWEDVDSVQTRSKLVGVDGSVSWDVKDFEGISEVEVVLLSKGNLGLLKILFGIAHVLESMNKFILVIDSEDWLSGWGHS